MCKGTEARSHSACWELRATENSWIPGGLRREAGARLRIALFAAVLKARGAFMKFHSLGAVFMICNLQHPQSVRPKPSENLSNGCFLTGERPRVMNWSLRRLSIYNLNVTLGAGGDKGLEQVS